MLIQTLAEMTPGMVLDVMVQKVLEDGSVVFSGGPVPDLILKASRYHRAGEFAPHVWETLCLLAPCTGYRNFHGRIVDELIQLKHPYLV